MANGRSPDSEQNNFVKVVVVGDAATGKSSLVNRIVEDGFGDAYIPTIGTGFYTKRITHNDKDFCLQFWDTAGNKDDRTPEDIFYHAANVFLMMFDLTDRQSFENLNSYKEKINEFNKNQNKKIIIIGTKSDLIENRKVTSEEGQALATTWGCSLLETSAKENINIQTIFDNILENKYENPLQKQIDALRSLQSDNANTLATKLLELIKVLQKNKNDEVNPIIINHFVDSLDSLLQKKEPIQADDIIESYRQLDVKLGIQSNNSTLLKRSVKVAICAVIGAMIGFFIGAVVGAIVSAWGGSFASVATAVLGAYTGFELGTKIGLAIGGVGLLAGGGIGFFSSRNKSKDLPKLVVSEEVRSALVGLKAF